ncbi:MAG: hypothetical protein H6Q59_323, partial [Firmicutes bacterium]|nr:hypothetical protein [Bacillota bacterium]
MLTDRQTEIMLTKLKRFEATLEGLLFNKVDEVSMQAYPTDGRYKEVPAADNFKSCKSGDSWVGEGSYCWFLGEYIVPNELDNKMLYVYPKIEGYEGLLWVDRKPCGNFGTKIQAFGHGNHYCDMLVKKASKNERIEIAMEYYAHHYVIGTQPFQTDPREDYRITYHSVDICVKNEAVWDAYFNLMI